MRDKETPACKKIHHILEELPEHSSPSSALPRNGLYVFYEPGEICAHTGKPRVVRVGNHPRSQDRLVTRLREHYGEIDYPEKKNGGVFRRLVAAPSLEEGTPTIHVFYQVREKATGRSMAEGRANSVDL